MCAHKTEIEHNFPFVKQMAPLTCLHRLKYASMWDSTNKLETSESYTKYVHDHFTCLESKQLNLDAVNPANTLSITLHLTDLSGVLLRKNVIKNCKDFTNAIRKWEEFLKTIFYLVNF